MSEPEKVFIEVNEETDVESIAAALTAALFGVPSPSPSEDADPR